MRKFATSVRYPILNFEYQGGTTLESFATHAGGGEYNTGDEAFTMVDHKARPNANG